MLKNKSLSYTPVSNIFIEKFMPSARGEFIKVYLLLLKFNTSGEIGVSSDIIASSLNLLESDIINALNYWNEEGVIKLLPIDKMGNFNIDFLDLSESSSDNMGSVDLLKALNEDTTKDMLTYIEKLLARPLSPKEMSTYLSWQTDFKFSSELILLLIEYCASKGKCDYRYIEKVAINWANQKITSIEQAQNLIKQTEDKWVKYKEILKYLGIKNMDLMKPQEDMLEKWVLTYNFPLDVIQKASKICFERLNRADFKYIDGILSSWHKNNVKTLGDVAKEDANFKNKMNKKFNFNSQTANNKNNNLDNVNNKKYTTKFNNFTSRDYDYDSLEKKLLGWDNDD